MKKFQRLVRHVSTESFVIGVNLSSSPVYNRTFNKTNTITCRVRILRIAFFQPFQKDYHKYGTFNGHGLILLNFGGLILDFIIF